MPRSPAAADKSIRAYRSKRDFSATSEPTGGARRSRQAPIFVVQKHAARRLHWDFRLQHGDVLWSWAVPKGPSLDPSDKRLAVRTEDHPLDYANFAGTIPQGQYGAGTVEIWDHGTWSSEHDAVQGLEQGELTFNLAGERLSGRFVLVRLKPRPKDHAENWLLIKSHDDKERAGADATRLEQQSLPVRKRKAKPQGRGSPAQGARKAALPAEQKPQLPSLTDRPPSGKGWLNEVKFDGYRLLLFKDHDAVRLMTRNGLDWTHRLPSLAREVGRLPVETAVIDGELVAVDANGVSSFALLQQALSSGVDKRMLCYVFDLLYLDGWDLRPCDLVDRKSVLATIADWQGMMRYSDHHIGEPETTRQKACELGLEGIICKKTHAPYHVGRGNDWLKLKCQEREEFIVVGWTPPAGSRTGLGALHVGYHDKTGALHYAGGVGTGFAERELASLRHRLDRIAKATPPELLLAGEPPDRTIRWVEPELVVEVQFAGWSGSGRLRHSVYLGLREDKTADEVIRAVADPQSARSR
jgi:bifunctional non-homologous end joining protein LigD